MYYSVTNTTFHIVMHCIIHVDSGDNSEGSIEMDTIIYTNQHSYINIEEEGLLCTLFGLGTDGVKGKDVNECINLASNYFCIQW